MIGALEKFSLALKHCDREQNSPASLSMRFCLFRGYRQEASESISVLEAWIGRVDAVGAPQVSTFSSQPEREGAK